MTEEQLKELKWTIEKRLEFTEKHMEEYKGWDSYLKGQAQAYKNVLKDIEEILNW